MSEIYVLTTNDIGYLTDGVMLVATNLVRLANDWFDWFEKEAEEGGYAPYADFTDEDDEPADPFVYFEGRIHKLNHGEVKTFHEAYISKAQLKVFTDTIKSRLVSGDNE